MFTAHTPSIDRFLSHQKWFRDLSAQARHAVLTPSFAIRCSKGDIVLPAQQTVTGWYGVVQGLVKIESTSGTQQSTFVGLGQGAWFGEGAILKKEARQYNVVALRDSVLVCVPSTVFEMLLARAWPSTASSLKSSTTSSARPCR
jgi:CRP-like cAMP-binding protein